MIILANLISESHLTRVFDDCFTRDDSYSSPRTLEALVVEESHASADSSDSSCPQAVSVSSSNRSRTKPIQELDSRRNADQAGIKDVSSTLEKADPVVPRTITRDGKKLLSHYLQNAICFQTSY